MAQKAANVGGVKVGQPRSVAAVIICAKAAGIKSNATSHRR